jgi:LemA protein
MIPQIYEADLRVVKGLGLITLLGIFIFLATLFYKFNSFIFLREDALAQAGNLEGAIQRRTNLFSNLVILTLNHASLEHAIFTNTSEARAEILKGNPSKETADKLMAELGKMSPGDKGKLPASLGKLIESLQSGAGMETLAGRLLAVVEQYPNIQSAKTYAEMMKSMVEMEDLIATRRVEYNLASRTYNTQISKFPWQFLAAWFDFRRMDYYKIEDSEDAPPSLSVLFYKQLMPFERQGGDKTGGGHK